MQVQLQWCQVSAKDISDFLDVSDAQWRRHVIEEANST